VRATFGVVLVAGIAAAVGLSMIRRGDGASGDATSPRPPASASSANPAPTPAPAPPEKSEPEPKREPAPSLPAGDVEDLFARKDLTGAAHAVLAATAQELAAPAGRDRAFRVADALVASADAAPDSAAIALRMDARRLYGAIYRSDEASTEEMGRAFDACTKLNRALLFGNGAPESLALRHKIQAGESVWALARGPWKLKGVTVPAGFVLHVNGIADARRVRVGQALRVPLEPMCVLVKKSRFELAVLLGGVPIERFTVAIGADSSTPTGKFKVSDRIKEPDWYMHGRRIPYGDPQNIIGTRWIGLTGSAAIEGIGIHGTTDDASVGRAVSMGCVRMHNADVEKLFEWLDSGVEVEIRD
jgi:L,D-transpeptidase-like protein